MTTSKSKKVNFTKEKHPLADFVSEKANIRKNGFDALCLTTWLYSPVPMPIKSMATWNAYKRVAVHVLACMEEAGQIYRDDEGWCYLSEWRNTQ